MLHLPWFLFHSNCSVQCGFCGTGFQSDVVLSDNNTKIASSRFLTYHTPSQISIDYIDSMEFAYQLSDQLNEDNSNVGLNVFPYSVFYIFFSQYVGIFNLLYLCLGLALLAVFLVSMFMLGNVLLAVVVLVMVVSIEVDIIGLMYLWDVELNAISMVNLVMAVGISVEFCVHLTQCFFSTAREKKNNDKRYPGENEEVDEMPQDPPLLTRNERVAIALEERGSSIIGGIFLTKLLGVIVLAFSASDIFRVYYFRMFFAMVIFGGFYGLTVLPVILSYVGPTHRSWFF